MRITEFAAAMNSHVTNLQEDFEITGISTLERAKPGEVSFVSNEKYLSRGETTQASALIVPEKVELSSTPTVALAEPWAGVLFLLNALYPESHYRHFSGVHPTAVVDPTAELGESVTVAPNAVIGPRTRIGARSVIGPASVIGADCTIGEDTLIHANVVVAYNCQIGNRVILYPGAVIGADGFKYEVIGGRWTKIPQVGTVVLEDGVEIGANTCVDRASFTETRVGANTKIDNLVQIAHNCQIGSECIIVSQSGIAGSSSVGDGSILAAQVGIADNLKLGKGVRIMAQSGVKDHLADRDTVVGTPARPFRQQARIYAAEARLPEIASELNKLKARVEELEKKQG